MAGQLIPLPEIAPPAPHKLTAPQRIQMWAELMNTCEQLLLAGLRRQLGSERDVFAAYHDWYEEQMAAHDRAVLTMVEEFNRRCGPHAG